MLSDSRGVPIICFLFLDFARSVMYSKAPFVWRISVDGRLNRRNNAVFRNFYGVVWTGPWSLFNHFKSLINNSASLIKRKHGHDVFEYLMLQYDAPYHREQRSPIWLYFQLNSPCNCSANRSVVDSNRCTWSNCKHAIVLRVGWNPMRSNGRLPKCDDSGKRSFPYEARSAESKKRDEVWNLPPRDSLDVDRSIPVTETEVEFCDLWSVPRECEINCF